MAALVSIVLLLTTALLLTLYIFVKILSSRKHRGAGESNKNLPPGPNPWPIIGSLHLLGGFETPFHAFTALAAKYGPIYSVKLGSSMCVVVNNFELIKEVLIAKGAHFGGRPDFVRYHRLFGGDRNNSLALCDWSDLQKTRRRIARLYCSPRLVSCQFAVLDRVVTSESGLFMKELAQYQNTQFFAKPLIMAACANMFTSYMCSERFSYNDPKFKSVVLRFDQIFWDINQGYAVDFMPWLEFAYHRHMKQLSSWAVEIRQFILSRVIESHRKNLQNGGEPKDFTDALLVHLESDPDLTWEHAIFELEDFIGGHSAVGNLIMLTLAAVVKNPHVGVKIQQEIDALIGGKRLVNLFDRSHLPYTEATILETLRLTSSPIVPHVASQETSIGGYTIPKDWVVFLNNYELNTGKDYFDEPEVFKPERFIAEGVVTKPAHFIPFSTGKRTCIGSKLVTACSFAVVAAILQNFNVFAGDSEVTIPKGCVALPPETFPFVFTPRFNNNRLITNAATDI